MCLTRARRDKKELWQPLTKTSENKFWSGVVCHQKAHKIKFLLTLLCREEKQGFKINKSNKINFLPWPPIPLTKYRHCTRSLSPQMKWDLTCTVNTLSRLSLSEWWLGNTINTKCTKIGSVVKLYQLLMAKFFTE